MPVDLPEVVLPPKSERAAADYLADPRAQMNRPLHQLRLRRARRHDRVREQSPQHNEHNPAARIHRSRGNASAITVNPVRACPGTAARTSGRRSRHSSPWRSAAAIPVNGCDPAFRESAGLANRSSACPADPPAPARKPRRTPPAAARVRPNRDDAGRQVLPKPHLQQPQNPEEPHGRNRHHEPVHQRAGDSFRGPALQSSQNRSRLAQREKASSRRGEFSVSARMAT